MPYTVIPVIVSGGAGTRLWPLSTPEKPKQFHALSGAETLIQQTARRLAGSDGLRVLDPILICNRRHLDTVRIQMDAIGCAPSAIVLEPFGRNTAPVAMAAALLAGAIDPEALVLLMPSDHLIADPRVFAEAVANAAPAARDRIVLLGVKPAAPETGFGYIESGPPLSERLPGVFEVARFVEKPDRRAAEAYLESGRYLWNAGVFLFAPAVLTAEMEQLAPAVAASTAAALRAAVRQAEVVTLDAEAFAACPSISLDYAVMEKTERAAVACLDAGWADIGSWNSLWSEGARDAQDNLVRGDAHLIDVEDSLVWSEDRAVGVIGLKGVVVVQTENAVLVLPKARAQEVKRLAEQVAARNQAVRP